MFSKPADRQTHHWSWHECRRLAMAVVCSSLFSRRSFNMVYWVTDSVDEANAPNSNLSFFIYFSATLTKTVNDIVSENHFKTPSSLSSFVSFIDFGTVCLFGSCHQFASLHASGFVIVNGLTLISPHLKSVLSHTYAKQASLEYVKQSLEVKPSERKGGLYFRVTLKPIPSWSLRLNLRQSYTLTKQLRT